MKGYPIREDSSTSRLFTHALRSDEPGAETEVKTPWKEVAESRLALTERITFTAITDQIGFLCSLVPVHHGLQGIVHSMGSSVVV